MLDEILKTKYLVENSSNEDSFQLEKEGNQ